jgi:hypothetical protein
MTTNNGKGENMPKFLKEMQSLYPALSKKFPHMVPGNREEARKAGASNAEEFMQRKMEELAQTERFRAHKVNTWFDERMKELSPRLFDFAKKRKKPWLFKWAGFSFSQQDAYHNTEGVTKPCTVCLIRRFGRLKTGIRMIWEEPQGPKRKGRIIRLD